MLWTSGLIGLIDIVGMFYFFWFRLPDVAAEYRRQTAGNIFTGIGEISLSGVNPDWGAAVLLLGTMASLGVAMSLGFRKPIALSTVGKVTVVFALILLVLAAYRVLLVCFPYLAYWPSLFES